MGNDSSGGRKTREEHSGPPALGRCQSSPGLRSAREELACGMGALGLGWVPRQMDQMARHIEEIRLFNPVFKLVGDPMEMVPSRHVLDSLAGVRLVEQAAKLKGKDKGGAFRVADLGSGAGFPGIPLAVMLPEISFTLIERTGRRAGFLRNVILATGLQKSVDLMEMDAKDVRRKFDLVVMRAFRPLDQASEEALGLLEDDGAILAWKAKRRTLDTEIEALRHRLPGVFDIRIFKVDAPFPQTERHLCLLTRAKRP